MKFLMLLPLWAAAAAFAAEEPKPEIPAAEHEGDAVVVRGRAEDLVGRAASSSEGRVGAEDLARRPLLRPGELLETVPGVVISQHSGAGKANQYYTRGFNLDHGTDFATYVDGVPVNLRTHGHGQGYTDLGFFIPELVEELSYDKGPYSAEDGDFSTVGSAHFRYARRLPKNLLSWTQGEWGHRRLLAAGSHDVGGLTLLGAAESLDNLGPWDKPEDFHKRNLVAKLSYGGKRDWASLTLMGYDARWNASDQIPRRALEQGLIGRFGRIGDHDGGNSLRRSASLAAAAESAWGRSSLDAYWVRQELDLFSNFTYFLDDPARGDQYEQVDRRHYYGATLRQALDWGPEALPQTSTLGLDLRRDDIWDLGLHQTEARVRHNTVRQDQVWQSSWAPWFQQESRWTPWLRSRLGLRYDAYCFQVESLGNTVNSGTVQDAMLSPKAGLVLGPWARTELYASYGEAFHSNDARGATLRHVPVSVDPPQSDPLDANGDPVKPAPGLVKTRGSEVGLRTAWLPGLQSTLSLWTLTFDSELVFVGDAGAVEAGRASYRRGVEFANFYAPLPWLRLDLDYSLSQGWFTQTAVDPATGEGLGQHIPGALEDVVTAGISVDAPLGLDFGARLRHFGPRPLVEDNSVRSRASTTVNLRVGWRPHPNYYVMAELFNAFNAEADDIEYFYESALPTDPDTDGSGDPGPVADGHIHPAEPRQLRVTARLEF